MTSRRSFLKVGLQAGTLASVGLGMRAQAQSKTQTTTPSPELPPSIAALKSMKDWATPITPEERRARQEKARQLMSANNIDAILMMEGTSLNYFTGVRWWGGERLFAMLLPRNGKSFYVCPAFEEGRAREQLSKSPDGANADVRTWQEDQNPYQLVAQGLRDRGLSGGTLGMEETIRFIFSDGIAKAAAQTRITSATPVTAGCRMIKSEHEVALMRLAAHATLTAYEAVYRSLSDGMTQAQVEDLVSNAYDKLGFPGEASVEVDAYSASPHGSSVPQVIHEGSIIVVDDGCEVEGYTSDITRTFTLGKASDKMKRVFDVVHRAQSAALQTARPGVECQSIEAAARKIITDASYGPDYKFFTHRLGHGMGMDMHEWPYLVRGNTTPLAANMTTSNEPGIYIPGEFGIRLEDDMHVTENGAELFTSQSPSLEEPFARS